MFLAQQALGGEISIRNRNCVWQGLIRTNQAKFHILFAGGELRDTGDNRWVHLPRHCTALWITVHAGRTQKVDVVSEVGVIQYKPPVMSCNYYVQPEGTAGGTRIDGAMSSKQICELDWFGICQCRPE